MLGRLVHKAPRILGGNRKRSRELLDRAISIAPSNSVTLMYAAELAIDDDEPGRAATLLHQLIDSPIEAEWEFENNRDRDLARYLLEQIGKA